MTEENPNIGISRDLQKKFDFYFLALVFTVLGLTIQTASETKVAWTTYVECGAWVCLLCSALAGLSRMEWLSVVYQQHGTSEVERRDINKYDEALSGRTMLNTEGKPMTRQEILERRDALQERYDERRRVVKELEKKNNIKYFIHKWGFVLALVLLVVSRGVNLFPNNVNIKLKGTPSGSVGLSQALQSEYGKMVE